MFSETIAAIATAAGGAIGVVRLSGPKALETALKVWSPMNKSLNAENIEARKMYLGKCISEGREEEQALLVYMPGPNSYSGENVVELQCHGGHFSTKVVLGRLLEAGAQHAEPGEFTKRAFINGKMDLTQAEAVIDIINSHSEMALHAANRQLSGAMGRRTNGLYDECRDILAEVEVRMDFADEDLDFESGALLKKRIDGVRGELAALIKTKQEGEVLRHGVKIVLAGAPNAGKSSLMNLFLGRDRAIVTEIPGTTRDVLEEFAHVRGIPIRLFDTAGIREASDIVEKIGVDRSKDFLNEAQIILWVIDSTLSAEEIEVTDDFKDRENMIILRNKIDEADSKPLPFETKAPVVDISALKGDGYDQLLDAIETMVWKYPHSEDIDVAVNARHAALLEEAQDELDMAEGSVNSEEWELVAVSLRAVLACIGSITGESISPDILDNIFGKFCIGK